MEANISCKRTNKTSFPWKCLPKLSGDAAVANRLAQLIMASIKINCQIIIEKWLLNYIEIDSVEKK